MKPIRFLARRPEYRFPKHYARSASRIPVTRFMRGRHAGCPIRFHWARQPHRCDAVLCRRKRRLRPRHLWQFAPALSAEEAPHNASGWNASHHKNPPSDCPGQKTT